MKLRITFGERKTMLGNYDFVNKTEANALILVRCLIYLEVTVVVVKHYFGATKTNFVDKNVFLFTYLLIKQS